MAFPDGGTKLLADSDRHTKKRGTLRNEGQKAPSADPGEGAKGTIDGQNLYIYFF